MAVFVFCSYARHIHNKRMVVLLQNIDLTLDPGGSFTSVFADLLQGIPGRRT